MAKSPVTLGEQVSTLEVVSRAQILDLYRRELNFNVAPYLPEDIDLTIKRCELTGYRYFDDVRCVGTSEFYKNLYGLDDDWAYQDSKWEHRWVAGLDFISGNVLDIGCGEGQFLSLIKGQCKSVKGIETNPKAFKVLNQKEIAATDKELKEFAVENKSAFEIVSAFQVLEHVYHVREFIESMIRVVKPGGHIIISVPNNDSFIGSQMLPLNLPPHHVGYWNPDSLEKLQKFFPLRLLCTKNEPLQEQNIGWYKANAESKIFEHNRLLKALYYKLGMSGLFESWLRSEAANISSHTTCVVFQVNKES